MTIVFRVLLAAGLALLVGCATTTGSTAAPKVNPEAQAVKEYHIGVDDSVQVVGLAEPGPERHGAGAPGRQDLRAAGRRRRRRRPHARGSRCRDQGQAERPSCAIRRSRSSSTELRSHEYLSRVRVTGAVRQPISVPYRQGMTVLDAVLAAGGANEFAAPDRTELYRKEGDRHARLRGAARQHPAEGRPDHQLSECSRATSSPCPSARSGCNEAGITQGR